MQEKKKTKITKKSGKYWAAQEETTYLPIYVNLKCTRITDFPHMCAWGCFKRHFLIFKTLSEIETMTNYLT